MAEIFLSYLVLYGISSNIMLNGSGVTTFQREKQYMSFRWLSIPFLMIGIALTTIIAYFLQKYVFSTYDLYYVSATVNVFFVGLYNLLVAEIWKKNKRFNFYLYDNAFSYAFDTVFTLSVIFTLDMTVSIGSFFLELAAVEIVVLISSALIGFYIKSLNRGYMNVSARNVPARLFLLAVVSIILYYIGILAT